MKRIELLGEAIGIALVAVLAIVWLNLLWVFLP